MERWKKHRFKALGGEEVGRSALYDAILAHGLENFVFEIIGWYEDYNDKERI